MPATTPSANASIHSGPDDTALDTYVRWLRGQGREIDSYQQLWRWSVENLDDFWASLWDYFTIDSSYETVLASRDLPGAQWFPGAALNYAERVLGHGDDSDRPAILAYSQTRDPVTVTFGELAERVGRARAGLVRLGVGRGDRVVAMLPNIPETVVAFLACASLGAIWASCAPEFGPRSIVDRFAQLEPTVLITVGGYTYGSKPIDKTADVAAVRAGLPTVGHVVGIKHGPYEVVDAISWGELLAEPGPPTVERVPFEHPLWVLFSSGTTGLPKAIVHSHGGILLEHLKTHALQLDTRPGDRILWFTTTAWMMWNILVSALLRRATAVLFDGNFGHPDLGEQWRLAADAGATLLGTSPAYLMACRDAGLQPARHADLASLRTLGVTGAPLPATGFDWATNHLGEHVLVNAMSGGTDVCTGFVAGNPWLPAYRGELAGPCLGVDVTVLDPDGAELVGDVGELVIRQPMPSMPLCFWNDPGGQRYRDSYFDTYPGTWRHGDWATQTDRASFVLSGRSDATLNRGGVRLGTAEFYTVVEELGVIADSLVIHLEDPEGGAGRLLLFVTLVDGTSLDEALRQRIRAALRNQLSPRHIPDAITAVPAIPRTLTGKKLETPLKNVLQGHPVTEVISPDAVSDYEAIAAFTEHRTALP